VSHGDEPVTGCADAPAEHDAERFAAGSARPARNGSGVVLSSYSHRHCKQEDLEGHVWPADYIAKQMTKKAINALSAAGVPGGAP
jgi:hypothetical protein